MNAFRCPRLVTFATTLSAVLLYGTPTPAIADTAAPAVPFAGLLAQGVPLDPFAQSGKNKDPPKSPPPPKPKFAPGPKYFDKPPGSIRRDERVTDKMIRRGLFERPVASTLCFDDRLSWGVSLGGAARVSAVHDEKNVYAATTQGELSALALDDGETQWSVKLSNGPAGRPMMVKGRIVLPLRSGDLVSVDPVAGGIRTSMRPVGMIDNALVSDGELVVATTSVGTLIAVDPTTLHLIATFQSIPGIALGEPVIAGKKAFFSDATGEVRCVEFATGKLLWSHEVHGAVHAPLLVVDGIPQSILVGTVAGDLFALDTETGKETWKTQGYAAFIGGCMRNGAVYATFKNRRTFVFDAATGRELENRNLRAEPVGLPLVIGDLTLVPGPGGNVDVLDANLRSMDPLYLNSELIDAAVSAGPIILTTESGDVYRWD